MEKVFTLNLNRFLFFLLFGFSTTYSSALRGKMLVSDLKNHSMQWISVAASSNFIFGFL